jgi:putative acyl-CoA dehydrogenase
VICLDLLRTLRKEPAARDALAAELRSTECLPGGVPNESEARSVVERIAIALQVSLIAKAGRPEEADAFRRSRTGGSHTFGTLEAAAVNNYLPRV